MAPQDSLTRCAVLLMLLGACFAPGSVPAAQVPCEGGFAGSYPCRNVDLFAFMPLGAIGGGFTNDIWGWTDPQSGREYAIVGRYTGTSFIDLSDPENPVYVGDLPPHTFDGFWSFWRDVDVYQNHAFIVSEAPGHGIQVFDLTQLRAVVTPPVTFAETAHYPGLGSAHTIFVNGGTGFAYAAGSDTCFGGLHVVDVQDPLNPSFAGCVDQDGYVHDTQCVPYVGPDAGYVGREVCLNSNEDTLTIVDVTDKSEPVQLSRTGYAGAGYTHQGWLTEDHRYFLLDDELDEVNFGHNSRTYIWDVSDLDAPVLLGHYTATSPAIDHNLYVRGGFAFEANYRSGLRILRLDDLASARMSEVAFFDIFPANDAPAILGAWSTYPFFQSGVVVVSGIESGLFVLRPTLKPGACPTVPAPGCRRAGRSLVLLEDDANDQRDRLVWKWGRGPGTSPADFGNPTATTEYGFCLYAGASATLGMEAVVAAAGTCGRRDCWKSIEAGGYRYRDLRGSAAGIVGGLLRAGDTEDAKVVLTGKGEKLGLPALPLQEGDVTVQLRNSDTGQCWEAVYPPGVALQNEGDLYMARIP